MPAQVTPELALAQMRRLVEGTARSLTSIAAELGVSLSTVSLRKKIHGWRRPSDAPLCNDRAPLSRNAVCPGLGACPKRDRLHAALYEALEKRIALEQEREVGDDPDRVEAAVKLLSAMTQTLARLVVLDERIGAARTKDEAADAADDTALRAELARRIARLADAQGAGALPGEGDEPGDPGDAA